MHKRSGQLLKRMIPAAMLVTTAVLVGCSDGNNSTAAVRATEVRLPVSTIDMKTALLTKVANPYWMDVWNNTQTEHDWREIEHLAFQVEVGGALLKIAGTGPSDSTWVANPDWNQLAEQLTQDGARAVNAVRSRNRELMDRAGPQLIETCDACHRAFAPNVPALSDYRTGLELPPVSR